MPPLWNDNDFRDDEVEFWAQELFGAAIDLSCDRRNTFLQVACEGSDRLKERVTSLLESAMETGDGQPLDQIYIPGDVVCDCLILCKIGRGGTAEVYKAIQKPLRRLVAVKAIKNIRSSERTALAGDATCTSSFQHNNIVAVYDADFEAEPPCVVMEFVDGITLREWLRREHERLLPGELAQAAIKSIAEQVMAALREAHSRGLIHRDIKPENILLHRSGGDYQVKLVDFGLARYIDRPGIHVAGTPGYIAPEQLKGAPADRRGDIFSLGVVLYEMLTGKHPFTAETEADTFFNTLHHQPEMPGGKYDHILGKALQKVPGARYQSIDEMYEDLRAIDRHDEGTNPFLSEFTSSVQRWFQGHLSGFSVAAVSCLLGCVSLVLSLISGAACIRVFWKPLLGGAGLYDLIYGYAVEPNAGLWYVLGAPLGVIIAFAFLNSIHVGLARTSVLTVADPHSDMTPLEHIAATNRRYFAYIAPAVVLFSLCFVLIPEVAFRHTNAFGWVQADLAGGYVNAVYDDLRREGTIGDLPALGRLCSGCAIRVAAVYNGSDGYRPPNRFWFGLFLASALTHEIAFTALSLYIVLKILFFFALLSRALLGNERSGVRLKPDLADQDDHRLGLGRLDNVYYAILFLLVLASLGRLLQATANLHKGTDFFQGKWALPLVGQPIVLISTLIVFVIFILTPVIIFMLLTIRSVDHELARLSVFRKTLEQQLDKARFPQDRDRIQREISALQERRDIIRNQSLLPTKQPLFWYLIGANVVLLIIPVLLGTDTHANVWYQISRYICAACGNSPPTQ